MQHRRTITAVLSLGLLVVVPAVWGCESAGLENCGMSERAMPSQQELGDCHDSETTMGLVSQTCGCGPGASSAHCLYPGEPEPVRIDSAGADVSGPTQLALVFERVEREPPNRPSESTPAAISSQRHDLGRFILFSSFLL